MSFWRSSWDTPAFASALLKECRRLWNDKARTERPATPLRSRILPPSIPAFAMRRLKAIDKPLLPLPGLLYNCENTGAFGLSEIVLESRYSSSASWIGISTFALGVLPSSSSA